MSSHKPTPQATTSQLWKSAVIATDGSVHQSHINTTSYHNTAIAYRLENTSGNLIEENNEFLGKTKSCALEAEALAVYSALLAAKEHNVTSIYLHTDSEPLANHLTDKYPIESEYLQPLLDALTTLLDDFIHTTIKHVSRNNVLIEPVHNLASNAHPD